jgi:hypothetical protein
MNSVGLCKILTEIPKEKRPVGRPKKRWKIILKYIDIKETVCQNVGEYFQN